MINRLVLRLKGLKGYADWNLLLFLVLFLNVKLAVKIPAIAFIYLLQPDFKFGLSFKNTRLPVFYVLVIAIAVLNWALNARYQNFNYTLVLLTGTGFWALCLLASHQVKYAVEYHSGAQIHHTILIYFIMNAVISVCNIAAIMWETGAFNPYLYQGYHQKYFIGTGDFIKGITFDMSITNAMLNALGLVYFLIRKNMLMVCICMSVLLLAGSNATNIILFIVFCLLFIFRSDKDQKSLILCCVLLMAVFMVRISPQNSNYAIKSFRSFLGMRQELQVAAPANPITLRDTPDELLSAEQRRQKTAQMYIDSISAVTYKKTHPGLPVPVGLVAPVALPPAIPQPDLNSALYQPGNDTDAQQARLLRFINMHHGVLPLSTHADDAVHVPGKMMGMLQTLNFLHRHPAKIFIGNGLGNFASKLAFRATDLGFSGGYSHRFVYINPDFLSNHLDVYLHFFSKQVRYRSLTNSPYATYDQLLGEYGLLGLLAFFICYVWFFAKHYQHLTYGIPVLLIMLACFFTDYWFEQLSVVVFFELLLFLDIKEHGVKPAVKLTANEK